MPPALLAVPAPGVAVLCSSLSCERTEPLDFPRPLLAAAATAVAAAVAAGVAAAAVALPLAPLLAGAAACVKRNILIS